MITLHHQQRLLVSTVGDNQLGDVKGGTTGCRIALRFPCNRQIGEDTMV